MGHVAHNSTEKSIHLLFLSQLGKVEIEAVAIVGEVKDE